MRVATCPPGIKNIATMSLARGFVIASIQRAMLGEATADLRAVAVGPDRVRARFVNEPPATELAERTVTDIEGELLAALLPGQQAEAGSRCCRSARGSSSTMDEFWVFRRREQR